MRPYLHLLHDSTENAQCLDTCEPVDTNDEVRRSVSFHTKNRLPKRVGWTSACHRCDRLVVQGLFNLRDPHHLRGHKVIVVFQVTGHKSFFFTVVERVESKFHNLVHT